MQVSTFTPITSPEHEHQLCDSCSCGVANDDWTHLDYWAASQEESDKEYATILATLEVLGWLSHSHKSDDCGYFNCAVCDDIQCGNPQIWIGDK